MTIKNTGAHRLVSMFLLPFAGLTLSGCAAAQTAGQSGSSPEASALPWPSGFRVGHAQMPQGPTGCTVVITRGDAVGGVDVRGGAPGTVETDLLDPVNMVGHVDAVVLSGGSAYGLATRDGVMRFLESEGQGFRVGPQVIPIVAGAILYDLGVAPNGVRPDADCGRRAAEAAVGGSPESGSVGAGTGATVGKLRGSARAMRGGIGVASIELGDGLIVAAVVAVNAVGDVVDPETGAIVAGVRGEGDVFLDARRILREEGAPDEPGGNTTIGVVLTNAVLTKAQATKIAQMAQDGLARAIVPSHTPSDGDTMFVLGDGLWTGNVQVGRVGAIAADVVSAAILDAVRSARGLPGIPSVSDIN